MRTIGLLSPFSMVPSEKRILRILFACKTYTENIHPHEKKNEEKKQTPTSTHSAHQHSQRKNNTHLVQLLLHSNQLSDRVVNGTV